MGSCMCACTCACMCACTCVFTCAPAREVFDEGVRRRTKQILQLWRQGVKVVSL